MRPAPPIVRQSGQDVLVAVHVQPRASRDSLTAQLPVRITIHLTAPPVGGAANTACCAFLAEYLDIPKSRLAVHRGETSREKLIRIQDADARDILTRLQAGLSTGR